MRIRKAAFACAVLLIPGTLLADDHRADRFAGFSYGQGSSLFGIHYTDAVTLPGLRKDLSAVYADLAAHFGSEDGSDVARFSYMTGLRWTFAKEPTKQGEPKFLPFLQGLVGGVYNDRVGEGDNDLALAVGGGLEYVLNRETTRGTANSQVALRAQADYFVKGGEDFPRFSFGVVIRSK